MAQLGNHFDHSVHFSNALGMRLTSVLEVPGRVGWLLQAFGANRAPLTWPAWLHAIGNISIPNIVKILTNIGHRFVHQSGLDESSGHKSTIFRHRIPFHVYLMFSQIGKNAKY